MLAYCKSLRDSCRRRLGSHSGHLVIATVSALAVGRIAIGIVIAAVGSAAIGCIAVTVRAEVSFRELQRSGWRSCHLN